MDASASPRLDGGLNGSAVTDGEESRSGDGPAAAAPGVTVVQLADGQTVQLQGVIQAPQTSVIQAPHVQTVQAGGVAQPEDDESVTDTQKRRVLLSRRPSYRKILNELSSDSPAVPKIDEEKTEEDDEDDDDDEEEEEEEVSSAAAATTVPTSIYQTSSGQYIAITPGGAVQLTGPGGEAFTGAQSVVSVAGSHGPQNGATVLQCAAQPGDAPQQFYLQGGQVLVQAATGDIPAYQLRSPNSGLAHSIVMAASPGSMQNPPPHHSGVEVTRKREVRLMKNREAARECRRKKKEYVKCLENRVAVLENQNKTLIEELKALKDIYCHKAE